MQASSSTIKDEANGWVQKRRKHADTIAQYQAERARNDRPPPSILTDKDKAVISRLLELQGKPAPAFVAADEERLEVEVAAIDKHLDNLAREAVEAERLEGEAWAVEHAHQWRALVRELLLSALRTRALHAAAAALLEKVPPGTKGWVLAEFISADIQAFVENLDRAAGAAGSQWLISMAELGSVANA